MSLGKKPNHTSTEVNYNCILRKMLSVSATLSNTAAHKLLFLILKITSHINLFVRRKKYRRGRNKLQFFFEVHVKIWLKDHDMINHSLEFKCKQLGEHFLTKATKHRSESGMEPYMHKGRGISQLMGDQFGPCRQIFGKYITHKYNISLVHTSLCQSLQLALPKNANFPAINIPNYCNQSTFPTAEKQ